jgi:cytochrome c556
MTVFTRSARISGVVAAGLTLVLLMAFSQTLASRVVSAGQSDKPDDVNKPDEVKKANRKVATPPVDDDGSADKKDEPGQALARFMRQKLQASNMILEGLCTEDLAMVEGGSGTLMKMSGEEKWRVSNDILYRRYSTEFIHAVEELQQEAKDHDMDGTSLAWVNVTMKCLKCHEWVRNTILAESAK